MRCNFQWKIQASLNPRRLHPFQFTGHLLGRLGQTARLSWSLTGELADSLGDRSELLLKLPVGFAAPGRHGNRPGWIFHLPASLEGQAVFGIQSEASETGWLDASLVTADAEQARPKRIQPRRLCPAGF